MVAFVAWMIGWPVVCSVCSLLSANTRRVTGEKAVDKDTAFWCALIDMVLYVWLAMKLWGRA